MVLLELQAAVATCPRFCFFVQVYVHLRVAQGTTASIAGYDAVLHLIHRLLCYQINGKVLIHLESGKTRNRQTQNLCNFTQLMCTALTQIHEVK